MSSVMLGLLPTFQATGEQQSEKSVQQIILRLTVGLKHLLLYKVLKDVIPLVYFRSNMKRINIIA
jgi:hypothetical protein